MAPAIRPSAPNAADPGRVRQLLDAVLPGDTELAAFCQDCFPQVRALFTAAMVRAQRVELLLARVADEHEVEARLRAFAPNAAAWGPQRSAWPYVLLGLALFTALLGGFLAWRMTMARRPQGLVPAAGAGTGGPWARQNRAFALAFRDDEVVQSAKREQQQRGFGRPRFVPAP